MISFGEYERRMWKLEEAKRDVDELAAEIDTLKKDIVLAEDLLHSRLGDMLDAFCGNKRRTDDSLDAIRREIKDSGNPWGVRPYTKKDRPKGESYAPHDCFYVGFQLWGWFNYYSFESPFDLKDDIEKGKHRLQMISEKLRKAKECLSESIDSEALAMMVMINDVFIPEERVVMRKKPLNDDDWD